MFVFALVVLPPVVVPVVVDAPVVGVVAPEAGVGGVGITSPPGLYPLRHDDGDEPDGVLVGDTDPAPPLPESPHPPNDPALFAGVLAAVVLDVDDDEALCFSYR